MALNTMTHMAAIAVIITGGTLVQAQTPNASFNAAIRGYVKIVKDGDISRQVGLYEKGGLGDEITPEQLKAALLKIQEARGKPLSCEVIRAFTQNKAGYATFDVQWKQGIREKQYTLWVRDHGKWRLTGDSARVLCPDKAVWKEYDAILLEASKCVPESEGDKDVVIRLTSDVINAIRNGRCDIAKKEMSIALAVALTRGWDGDEETEYNCKTFFTDMVRSARLLDKPFVPSDYECTATWKTGRDFFMQDVDIPGHPGPKGGCRWAGWEVTIRDAAAKPPRDLLVVSWIYTPQGLRLADIQIPGVCE